MRVWLHQKIIREELWIWEHDNILPIGEHCLMKLYASSTAGKPPNSSNTTELSSPDEDAAATLRFIRDKDSNVLEREGLEEIETKNRIKSWHRRVQCVRISADMDVRGRRRRYLLLLLRLECTGTYPLIFIGIIPTTSFRYLGTHTHTHQWD